MNGQRYPTGADVTAYMTEGRTLSGPVTSAFLSGSPPKSVAADRLRSDEHRELDVAHVTVVDDGQVTPLYKFTDRMASDFMYSRSMVNVELQFNYSEEFVRRHRTPTIQQIRGKSLWLLMEKAQWWPKPAVIRDLVRIDDVYEHTMRHEPNPHASEQVPCTAREMSLVGRREQQMDARRTSRIIEEGGTPQLPDAFERPQSQFLGQVDYVNDGDTMDVTLEATGESVDVRLSAVDTPETEGSPRQNDPGLWTWPGTRGPGKDNGYGATAADPTVDQLEKWGKYAKYRVKDLLEWENVWLVADPGAAPTDDPELNPQPKGEDGRFIFQVRPTVPLPTAGGTERDLGTWLVKRGLARARTTTSIGPNGNRAQTLRTIEEQNRRKAGTEEATGIFYAHDVANWDGAGNDANTVTTSTAAWENIKNR